MWVERKGLESKDWEIQKALERVAQEDETEEQNDD